MNSINKLANFLFQSGLEKEAAELLKIAAYTKEDLEKQFPNLFKFYRDDINPNMAAGMFKGVEKLLDTDPNALSGIQKFEDLQSLLKSQKKQKIDKFFRSIIKEYGKDVPIEELESARKKGLNKEEILFLLRDKQNHSWQEKIDMAYQFNDNKARIEGLGASASITKFENIDIAHSKIFSNLGGDKYLREFYSGIRDEALKSSDVVYNSKKYIVVATKSETASQYWEQSAVSIDKNGEIIAGLCTARHNFNYFNHYYDKDSSLIFVIITKDIPTILEIPYTKFSSKNYAWNLISMQVRRLSDLEERGESNSKLNDKTEIVQGEGATVNRQNENVFTEDIAVALGDELDNVLSSINNYMDKIWSGKTDPLELSIKSDYRDKSRLGFVADFSPNKFYSKENLEQFQFFSSGRYISDLIIEESIYSETKNIPDEYLIKLIRYASIKDPYEIVQYFTFSQMFKDKSLFKKEFSHKIKNSGLNIISGFIFDTMKHKSEAVSSVYSNQEIIDIISEFSALDIIGKENSQSYKKSIIVEYLKHLNKAKTEFVSYDGEEESKPLYIDKDIIYEASSFGKSLVSESFEPYEYFKGVSVDLLGAEIFPDVFYNMFAKIDEDKFAELLKEDRKNLFYVQNFTDAYINLLNSDSISESEKNIFSEKLKSVVVKSITELDIFDESFIARTYISSPGKRRYYNDLMKLQKMVSFQEIESSIINYLNKKLVLNNFEDAFTHIVKCTVFNKSFPEKVSDEYIISAAKKIGESLVSRPGVEFSFENAVDYLDDDFYDGAFSDIENIDYPGIEKVIDTIIEEFFKKKIFDLEDYESAFISLVGSAQNLPARFLKILSPILKEKNSQDLDVSKISLDANKIKEIKEYVSNAFNMVHHSNFYSYFRLISPILKNIDNFKNIFESSKFITFIKNFRFDSTFYTLKELGDEHLNLVAHVYLADLGNKSFQEIKSVLSMLYKHGVDIKNLVLEDRSESGYAIDSRFFASNAGLKAADTFNFADDSRFKDRVSREIADTVNNKNFYFISRLISKTALKDFIIKDAESLRTIIQEYKSNIKQLSTDSGLTQYKNIKKLGLIINKSELDNNNFKDIIRVYREHLKESGHAAKLFLEVQRDSSEGESYQDFKDFYTIVGKNVYSEVANDIYAASSVIRKEGVSSYIKFGLEKSTVSSAITSISKNRRLFMGRNISVEELDFVFKNFSYSIIETLEFIKKNQIYDLQSLCVFMQSKKHIIKYYNIIKEYVKSSIEETDFRSLFSYETSYVLENAPEDLKEFILKSIYSKDLNRKAFINSSLLLDLRVKTFQIGNEAINSIYLNNDLLDKAIMDRVKLKDPALISSILNSKILDFYFEESKNNKDATNSTKVLSSIISIIPNHEIKSKNLEHIYKHVAEKSSIDIDNVNYLRSRIWDSKVNNKDMHNIQKFISYGLHKDKEFENITNWITSRTDMLKVISDDYEENITSEIPVGEDIESLQVEGPKDDSEKDMLRERIIDNILKTLKNYDKLIEVVTEDLDFSINDTDINSLIFNYLSEMGVFSNENIISKNNKIYVNAKSFFEKTSNYFDNYKEIEEFADYLILSSEKITKIKNVNEELTPQSLDFSISQPETEDLSKEILEKNSGKKRYYKIKNIFNKTGQ